MWRMLCAVLSTRLSSIPYKHRVMCKRFESKLGKVSIVGWNPKWNNT